MLYVICYMSYAICLFYEMPLETKNTLSSEINNTSQLGYISARKCAQLR